MSTQTFTVLLEWDAEDHVWVTAVPALNFLSTYGDTREEALQQTREAIIGYIETARDEGIVLPAANENAELVQVEVAVA